MKLGKLEKKAARCEMCSRHKARNKAVFARGNPESKLVICGMCPGPDENKAGLPFVGVSGELLDEFIEFLDTEPYITNLVKCFVPPGTSLKPSWINACSPIFNKQMAIIKPKVIIALGKDVASFFFEKEESFTLGSIRGQAVTFKNARVIPTYHPGFLVRGGFKYRKDIIDDFKKANRLWRRRMEGVI